jgi:hypothetical protein
MGMTIDTRDFEKGLTNLVKTLEPEATAKGLFRAGSQLILDAINEQPYVPFDEGHLRGSGKVTKVEVTKSGAEVAAGFNKEYAARWHELTPEEDARINWSLPGSGRKYLESKLVRFKEDYMKIVAKYLENVLKRGGK